MEVLIVQLVAGAIAAVATISTGRTRWVLASILAVGVTVGTAAAIYDATANSDAGSILDFTATEWFFIGIVLTLFLLPGWAVGVAAGWATRRYFTKRPLRRPIH